MRSLKRNSLLLLLALSVEGCASSRLAKEPTSWPDDAPVQVVAPLPAPGYKISILSDPQGAHIEVRGNYLGDAPYTLNVDGWPGCERTFSNALEITALPNGDGYVQTKSFRAGDPIPERMIFVMGLHNVQPAIDLNVRQQ